MTNAAPYGIISTMNVSLLTNGDSSSVYKNRRKQRETPKNSGHLAVIAAAAPPRTEDFCRKEEVARCKFREKQQKQRIAPDMRS
ncbi:MAG: hypothetical protein JO110_12610 [Acetobacteraceae bacterium]|nr:hypothetical protein [Acetobacteraceae bacterium]